jgi:hypothetical protein
MIRNFKDIVILLITTGVLILLATIIVGDYMGSPRRKSDQSMKCHHTHENERYWFDGHNRRLYWWK